MALRGVLSRYLLLHVASILRCIHDVIFVRSRNGMRFNETRGIEIGSKNRSFAAILKKRLFFQNV